MNIEYEEFENTEDLLMYLSSVAPPMKNFIPSSCPSGGGTPELAPPACSGGTYNDHLQDPPSPPEDPCKQFMIDYPTIQDQKTFCKKECIGSANPMCKCCKELK